MNSYINALLSIPKTIYFNLRVFDFHEAIHLPVLVSYKCRIRKIFKHCITIDAPMRLAMIKIGFGKTPAIQIGSSELILSGGVMRFKGTAVFSEGINIRSNGIINIGNNFCSNANFRISCGDSITIGDDFLIGWNCSMRDSNGHDIIHKGRLLRSTAPIHIGNHVWCGAESHILKGTVLQDNSIVGFGSIVCSKFTQSNICIVGNPAQIIKEDVLWEA